MNRGGAYFSAPSARRVSAYRQRRSRWRALAPLLRGGLRLALLPLAIALVVGMSWYHFVFPGFRVEGVVRDRGGHALANARVLARAGQTTTDSDGRFRLDGIKPPEPLEVKAAGYRGTATRFPNFSGPTILEVEREQPTPSMTVVAPTPPAPPPAVLAPRLPSPAPTPDPFRPLLPEHRIVAYYGNPLAKQMGVLGELAPTEMVRRLQQQAAAYAAADRTRTVLPALELVTPAAQGEPGEDGLYRARMTPEVIEQVAQLAEANHALLILDVQVGGSSVSDEVNALLPYLRRPYVHLALDPEFAMPPGRAPGQVVGTLDASAVNGAIRTLADLVASEHLPPKLLVVHRFTEAMVTHSADIKPDPTVQVVVTMDGFGPPGLKLAQYDEYVHNQPVQRAGIKLFYHHDVPMLSPQQVVDLDPFPDLVIYQ